MFNIGYIRELLKYGFDYVLCHEDALNVPIELEMFRKSETEFFTMNEVHETIPFAFTPIDYLKPEFKLFRWSFPRDTGSSERAFIDMYIALGYVNMRQNDIEDINWQAVSPNMIGVFSSYEVTLIPKSLK